MFEHRGLPIIGSARAVASAPHLFMAELALQHGGIAAFKVLNRRMVVVADPDMAHELLVTKWQIFSRGSRSRNLAILGKGLLTMGGEEWFERRRLAQTLFTRDILAEVAHHSREGARAAIEGWEVERTTGGTVFLEDAMLRLSMSIISGMLLSSDVSTADADRIGCLLRRGLDLVLKRNTALWAPPIWLPTPSNLALLAVRRELTEFINSSLRSRGQVSREDIYHGMSGAQDPRTGRGFSPDALLEETRTLFFAGYETAATGMTWALYQLARHRDVANRLMTELDQVVGDREPVWEDLSRLPYLRAVLQETMRVFPPVYALPREALADDEIGGHPVERGTVVFASINGLHFAPVWGEDRGIFRPERFLAADWPRRAYMPFGAGRHLCIGSDFALTEMSIVIAMVLQRYRISTDSLVASKARVTMVPDRPIKLNLIPRRR